MKKSMKRFGRRVFTLLVAAAMFLSYMPEMKVSAAADSEIFEGGDTISSHNVTIAPGVKPNGWTYGTIGSDGNLNNYGGSITKKVGESGFYRRCPTNSISGGYCGHIVAEYTADYFTDFTVESSNKGVIGDVSYQIAKWNNTYGYCPQMTFIGKQPGKTKLTWTYYVNFMVQRETGYCRYCGRYTVIPADYTWHKYRDVIDVNVNADYALVYEANGDNVVKMPGNTTRTVTDKTTTLTVSGQQPERKGYKFLGWSEDPNAQKAAYIGGESIRLNWEEGKGSVANPVSKTLYAVWKKADPTTYKVVREYYIDGTKVATVSGAARDGSVGDQVYGQKLADENPGWNFYTVDDERYGFNFSDSNPEPLVLVKEPESNVITLKYVYAKTYTVIYRDGADGEFFGDESHGGLNAGDKTPGFSGNVNRKGYTFIGWKLTTGTQYNGTVGLRPTVGAKDANEQDEIIYVAQWKQITVTVKDSDGTADGKGTWNDGTDADKVLTLDEGKVTLPGKDSIMPPEGKELDKWRDQDGKEYEPGQEIEPEKDLTLIPVWKEGAPVEPTEPTEPPTNPTEPTEPPTNPTNPTNPTEPTEPSDPVPPTVPTEPSAPVPPTAPTVPSNPVTPENPTPGTPPADDGTNEVPNVPAAPAAPAEMDAAPAPVNIPATPVTPDDPEEEETDIPDDPVPEAEPEEEPEETQEDEPAESVEETEIQDIEEDETPLAAMGETVGKGWALLNLILAIFTAFASLTLLTLYFTGKNKDVDEFEEEELRRKGFIRILSVVPAVLAVITFALTEDMSNPMVIVDKWTLLMLLYAVVNVAFAAVAVKKREESKEKVVK